MKYISKSVSTLGIFAREIKIMTESKKKTPFILFLSGDLGSGKTTFSNLLRNKGEIVFKGTKKYDQGIFLVVTPNKKYFDFVMDAEQHFTIETDTSNYVKNMKVKGSAENKFFFDYQNFMFDKHNYCVQ